VARVDRIKEEIGWLKVPFGLLAVVDASLLGWLAQSYTKAIPVLVAAASVAAIVVTSGIFQINRIAYRRIDDLEEN
jgi:4-hydroxybenzoate polyprenyltransferase